MGSTQYEVILNEMGASKICEISSTHLHIIGDAGLNQVMDVFGLAGK